MDVVGVTEHRWFRKLEGNGEADAELVETTI